MSITCTSNTCWSWTDYQNIVKDTGVFDNSNYGTSTNPYTNDAVVTKGPIFTGSETGLKPITNITSQNIYFAKTHEGQVFVGFPEDLLKIEFDTGANALKIKSGSLKAIFDNIGMVTLKSSSGGCKCFTLSVQGDTTDFVSKEDVFNAICLYNGSSNDCYYFTDAANSALTPYATPSSIPHYDGPDYWVKGYDFVSDINTTYQPSISVSANVKSVLKILLGTNTQVVQTSTFMNDNNPLHSAMIGSAINLNAKFAAISPIMAAVQAQITDSFAEAWKALKSSFRVLQEAKNNITLEGQSVPCVTDIFGTIYQPRNPDAVIVEFIGCLSKITANIDVTFGPSQKDLTAMADSMQWLYNLVNTCDKNTKTFKNPKICQIYQDADRIACCKGEKLLTQFTDAQLWSAQCKFPFTYTSSAAEIIRAPYALRMLSNLNFRKRIVISCDLFRAIQESFNSIKSSICEDMLPNPNTPTDCVVGNYSFYYSTCPSLKLNTDDGSYYCYSLPGVPSDFEDDIDLANAALNCTSIASEEKCTSLSDDIIALSTVLSKVNITATQSGLQTQGSVSETIYSCGSCNVGGGCAIDENNNCNCGGGESCDSDTDYTEKAITTGTDCSLKVETVDRKVEFKKFYTLKSGSNCLATTNTTGSSAGYGITFIVDNYLNDKKTDSWGGNPDLDIDYSAEVLSSISSSGTKGNSGKGRSGGTSNPSKLPGGLYFSSCKKVGEIKDYQAGTVENKYECNWQRCSKVKWLCSSNHTSETYYEQMPLSAFQAFITERIGNTASSMSFANCDAICYNWKNEIIENSKLKAVMPSAYHSDRISIVNNTFHADLGPTVGSFNNVPALSLVGSASNIGHRCLDPVGTVFECTDSECDDIITGGSAASCTRFVDITLDLQGNNYLLRANE